MKKIIRLTESDLTRIVKKIILEFSEKDPHFQVVKITDENYNPEIDNIRNVDFEETDGGIFESERGALLYLKDLKKDDPFGIYVLIDHDGYILASSTSTKIGSISRIKKKRPKISFHKLKI
ncbi:hypothetical protein EBU91_03555 [bacterium]|nr:hypothetical protein [bacterium]